MSSFINLLKESKNEKKTESFKWLSDAEIAFCQLRKAFTMILILVHFNSEQKNQVETNASEHAIAEIYTQLQKSGL